MQIVELIIESAKDGELWGRVEYDDNLIVECADTLDALQKKMKGLLKTFHELNPKVISFDIRYEVAGFFESNKLLRATEVARKAGISETMIRQYSSGKKIPSLKKILEIEEAIHSIGRELLSIRIAPRDTGVVKAAPAKRKKAKV